MGSVLLLWVENLGVKLTCSLDTAVLLISNQIVSAGLQAFLRNIAVDDLRHRDVTTFRHEVKALRLHTRRRQVVPFQIILCKLGVGSSFGLFRYSLYGRGSVDGFLSASHIGQPARQNL